jgi:hypothetical protein
MTACFKICHSNSQPGLHQCCKYNFAGNSSCIDVTIPELCNNKALLKERDRQERERVNIARGVLFEIHVVTDLQAVHADLRGLLPRLPAQCEAPMAQGKPECDGLG